MLREVPAVAPESQDARGVGAADRRQAAASFLAGGVEVAELLERIQRLGVGKDVFSRHPSRAAPPLRDDRIVPGYPILRCGIRRKRGPFLRVHSFTKRESRESDEAR